jgi:hypothetical protein
MTPCTQYPSAVCKHAISSLLQCGGVRAVVTRSTPKTTTPQHHEGPCLGDYGEHTPGNLYLILLARLYSVCSLRSRKSSGPARTKLEVSQVKGTLTRSSTTNSISAVRSYIELLAKIRHGCSLASRTKEVQNTILPLTTLPFATHHSLQSFWIHISCTLSIFLAYSAPSLC